MSTDKASQGMIDANKQFGRAAKIATPDGRAIIRSAGNAVDAKDRADHKQRPPQKITGPQNWRRG